MTLFFVTRTFESAIYISSIFHFFFILADSFKISWTSVKVSKLETILTEMAFKYDCHQNIYIMCILFNSYLYQECSIRHSINKWLKTIEAHVGITNLVQTFVSRCTLIVNQIDALIKKRCTKKTHFILF